eukprot:CAMPEP_0117527230 /NCGR_PEP_ID=MMETSP0784-20121206/36688_1 /TAXON_ID=39447 /ORGANISM="" /LENGTH=179 /DNA_ID=CAMNT_0005323471 /DNA_START=42 /DNA_END=581 /DNA_ORIENTATION=-
MLDGALPIQASAPAQTIWELKERLEVCHEVMKGGRRVAPSETHTLPHLRAEHAQHARREELDSAWRVNEPNATQPARKGSAPEEHAALDVLHAYDAQQARELHATEVHDESDATMHRCWIIRGALHEEHAHFLINLNGADTRVQARHIKDQTRRGAPVVARSPIPPMRMAFGHSGPGPQ